MWNPRPYYWARVEGDRLLMLRREAEKARLKPSFVPHEQTESTSCQYRVGCQLDWSPGF